MDSFLMLGQSNMAGRGDFGEVREIRNPLCFMLRMGKWVPMSEPVNPDRAVFGIQFHSGISLAASFADEYAKHTGRDIGLIPCAYGGSKISEWQPGEPLFEHAIMQAELAAGTSEIKAALWHQGESDCVRIEDFDGYAERFKKTVGEIRKKLGISDLPFVIGEISDEISGKWQMEERNILFNERLYNLAYEVGNCAVASSSGLRLKDDGIHFDSASCREFGKRYFEVYLNKFI